MGYDEDIAKIKALHRGIQRIILSSILYVMLIVAPLVALLCVSVPNPETGILIVLGISVGTIAVYIRVRMLSKPLLIELEVIKRRITNIVRVEQLHLKK